MLRNLNLNLQAMIIDAWACELMTHIWLMMTAEPQHCGYHPLIIQTSQWNFLPVLSTTARPSAQTQTIVFLMKQSVKQYDVTITLQFWLYSTWFCSSHCPQKLPACNHPVSNTAVESFTLAWVMRYWYEFNSSIIYSFKMKGIVHPKIKLSSFIYHHFETKPRL